MGKLYLFNMASKENYDPRELESFMCECDDNNFEPLTSIEVEQLLSTIKLTAAGCDGLPAWLLCSCSYELADIVTIRYGTRCYFNVRSKADISQLNLLHGTDN